jgi:hypothetical protein
MYRNSKKVKGRTLREFHSSADVWRILEFWAEESKYEMVAQDANSRTYRKRLGVTHMVLIPMAKIGWTGSGYWLSAWSVMSGVGRTAMWTWPEETAIDQKSFINWAGDSYPLDARNIARDDVNALIEMLDAGIEPIP